MRKTITILAALLLCGALAACGAASGGTLYAEVAAIDGNRLTLKMLEGGMGGGRPGGMGRPEGGEPPEGFSMPEGMEPPEDMSRPGGSGFGRPEGEPPGGGGAPEPNYTGEEKEITIPDGTPIVTVSMEGTAQASSSDIQIGDTLQILYDGGQITQVQIMQMQPMFS